MRDFRTSSPVHSLLNWQLMLILPVLLSGSLNSSTAQGEVPVEGERELFELLRAAQSTNEAGFQRGALTAHIEATWDTVRDGEEVVQTQSGDVTLVWEGDRTYYEYTHRGTRSNSENGTVHAGRVLDLPDRRIWYNAEIGLAQIYFDKGRDAPWLVRVRPDQVWFRYFIPEGRTWKEILNPPATSSIVRFVVSREESDRVVVESLGQNSADNSIQFGMRIVASLSQGGNIISYEDIASPGETSSWDKGEYEWAPDGRGNWRLKRLVQTVIEIRGDDRAERHYELDVTDYNPEPVIPRNRFDVASLEFEPGTVVEESGGGRDRSYEIGGGGGEEPRVSEEMLDDLAERLRDAQFAAPKSSE